MRHNFMDVDQHYVHTCTAAASSPRSRLTSFASTRWSPRALSLAAPRAACSCTSSCCALTASAAARSASLRCACSCCCNCKGSMEWQQHIRGHEGGNLRLHTAASAQHTCTADESAGPVHEKQVAQQRQEA